MLHSPAKLTCKLGCEFSYESEFVRARLKARLFVCLLLGLQVSLLVCCVVRRNDLRYFRFCLRAAVRANVACLHCNGGAKTCFARALFTCRELQLAVRKSQVARNQQMPLASQRRNERKKPREKPFIIKTRRKQSCFLRV